LNISNITNLIQTFYNCYVLDCDFSNWKIDKNTIIEETFYNCFNLKGKGLKNWIIDISYEKIFKNCYSLNELPTLYDETKK
ncbi:MAG: BspA family leucine-rich repeat surface protein, partial [Thermoplasmata archaeon]